MITMLVLASLSGVGLGLVLRKRKAKKEASLAAARDSVEKEKKLEAAARTRALLEELRKKPGSTIVLDDPADIVSLIEHQQQIQQASEEMDGRATVPANYLMIH